MSSRRPKNADSSGLGRRQFLAAGGTGLLAAAIPGASKLAEAAGTLDTRLPAAFLTAQASPGAKKKIPIGALPSALSEPSIITLVKPSSMALLQVSKLLP